MRKTKENDEAKEIFFVNYILDTVHGSIGLTEMENRIERLPIFKRLQDISQLGLVKRVFPGALHNRYTHSLGVMHTIDQMALHLGIFNSAERQLLRLAGMLHDLGHYPLSHDLEQVYDRPHSEMKSGAISVKEVLVTEAVADIEKIMRVEMTQEGDAVGVENMQKPRRELVTKGPFHHESITADVIKSSKSIKKIIMDGIKEGYFDVSGCRWDTKSDKGEVEDFADRIICDICALIQGNWDYKYEEQSAFPRYFTAMIQLLHSELDADRIDYLLRDATFSGASYGSFDVGMLLNNLAVKEHRIGKEHAWIVGVKEKGIGYADQYMVNRYLAYTQVIYHKYTSIIGKMLREVVQWMMDTDRFAFYSQDEIKNIVITHEEDGAYYAFTDSYFFNRLNEIKKDDGCPDDIYYLVEQIKKFYALNLDFEDVFVGNTSHQKEHIEDTECYKYILDLKEQERCEEADGLYLFNHKKITNHVPFKIFKKNFNEYNGTHKAKLSFDKYQMDRLMDGLAVICDDEDASPILLIDAPRSMSTEIFDMRQLMLRKYQDIKATG